MSAPEWVITEERLYINPAAYEDERAVAEEDGSYLYPTRNLALRRMRKLEHEYPGSTLRVRRADGRVGKLAIRRSTE